MLSVPTAASAQDAMDQHLQSVMACRSVTPDAARLQCYDRSAATVTQAVEQGELRVEPQKRPRAREGVVKASGPDGENRYWIELENGDRWVLLPTTKRDGPPQPGTRIKVRKSFFDSGYWVSGDGWSEARARFVPKGS